MNPDDLDTQDMMSQVGLQNQQLENKNAQLAAALTSQGFQEQEEQNLIQTQLETDKILERVEHFLKGDQVKFGEQGAYFTAPTKNVLALAKKDPKTGITYYIQELKEQKKGTELLKEVLVKIENKKEEEVDVLEADSKRILEKISGVKLNIIGYRYVTILDDSKKPLNEYGVAELMRIMSMYVTKETFLSSYTEERINEILGDLGTELNKFMYCNYEKMGMDTKFKESKFIMLCLNLLHTVESCYRRALDSSEQEFLRSRAIVTQSQSFGGMSSPSRMPTRQKWHPFKPKTW